MHFVLIQQIAVVADKSRKAHYQTLAYRVDRGIGNLGKKLFKITGKVLRLIRQNGKRYIGPHGTDRFFAIQRHRLDNGIDILAAVTENLLVTVNGIF